jgi:hypothetical protein
MTPGAITTRFLGGDELGRGAKRKPLGNKRTNIYASKKQFT